MLLTFNLRGVLRNTSIRFISAEVAVDSSKSWASVSYTIDGAQQPAALLRFRENRFTDIHDRSLNESQLNYLISAAPDLVQNLESRLSEYFAYLEKIQDLTEKRLRLQEELSDIDEELKHCFNKTRGHNNIIKT